MPDEKKQGEALNALGEAMKRWGVKPEQLGPAFRELMAFTPEEAPMPEPKPITDQELDTEFRRLYAETLKVKVAFFLALGAASPNLPRDQWLFYRTRVRYSSDGTIQIADEVLISEESERLLSARPRSK